MVKVFELALKAEAYNFLKIKNTPENRNFGKIWLFCKAPSHVCFYAAPTELGTVAVGFSTKVSSLLDYNTRSLLPKGKGWDGVQVLQCHFPSRSCIRIFYPSPL